MMIVKIFYALIGLSMGLSILKYRKIVYSWTGRFYWAEKYLGSGGTIFIISLTGLGLIFWSVVYPFGVFNNHIQNNMGDSSLEEGKTPSNNDVPENK